MSDKTCWMCKEHSDNGNGKGLCDWCEKIEHDVICDLAALEMEKVHAEWEDEDKYDFVGDR